MNQYFNLFSVAAWACVSLSPAFAQATKEQTKPVKAETKSEPAKEALVQTNHVLMLAGKKLEYQATAGTLSLKDENDKALASMFFIAYTKTGPDNTGARPITFCFNGGPGSSSVWLHVGAFGPRRVAVGDVNENVAPPYHLIDNQFTLLDLTDLVFIDPVMTGYSRPAPGQNSKQFHGVQEDIRSVGDFIHLYVTRFNRWAAPKFLAGESYGTTRAAGLVGYLQDRHGMNLNGVILISCVLNFETIRFDDGNDLPYALYLPSYTSTAWYHKKLDPELQSNLTRTLAEVEEFAQGPYVLALMKGTKLPANELKDVVHKVARYTGLSEDYVRRANLRIEISRFTKELLRKEGQIVGRFDSRFVGSDLDAVGERPDFDPSFSAVQGPYTGTFNQYVRSQLKYEKDIPYEVLTGRVQPWEYGNAKNRYLNVAGTLRQGMVKNRSLRVFVANGYNDLATPYFATAYTFNHLEPEAGLADRVTMSYYPAGHMMYVHKPSLEKLKNDLAGFMHSAVPK